MEKRAMKIDLLIGSLEPIIKNFNDTHTRAFLLLCRARQKPAQGSARTVSIFEMFGGLDKKPSSKMSSEQPRPEPKTSAV
jgi:hypothetical protein